jgi:hypothetical protein
MIQSALPPALRSRRRRTRTATRDHTESQTTIAAIASSIERQARHGGSKAPELTSTSAIERRRL